MTGSSTAAVGRTTAAGVRTPLRISGNGKVTNNRNYIKGWTARSTDRKILTRLDSSGEAKLRSSTLTLTVRTPGNDKLVDNDKVTSLTAINTTTKYT